MSYISACISLESVDLARIELMSLIHASIAQIITQVPTGISILSPILEENFPHKRFSFMVFASYIEEILKISIYIPYIQYKILDLIIERCLEMDVEIVIEDDGEVRLQRDNSNNKAAAADDGVTGNDLSHSLY